MIPASKQGEHRSLGAELPVEPVANRIRVVILQHPQEPDKVLGTAALCVRSLKKAELKIGLSWPSFRKMLGEEAEPGRWGVLYLGGQGKTYPQPLVALDKKKNPLPQLPDLDGILLLDGTWSQAKALWWRNPWLLKVKRLVLTPRNRSLYGKLRREPRRECLSTIESAAYALKELGEDQEVADALVGNFRRMLEAFTSGQAVPGKHP